MKIKNIKRTLIILKGLAIFITTLLILDLSLIGYILIAVPIMINNTNRHEEEAKDYINKNRGLTYIKVQTDNDLYIWENDTLYKNDKQVTVNLKEHGDILICISDMLEDFNMITDDTRDYKIMIIMDNRKMFYRYNKNTHINELTKIFDNMFD